MKTVIWNRRLIDGSIKEVSFTGLFSEDNESIDTYLEEMARRQGIVRTEKVFKDELRKITLAYEIDLIFAKGRDEAITAGEYYATKAMILTVRYGLSQEENAQSIALKGFKDFLAKIKFNPSEDILMAS